MSVLSKAHFHDEAAAFAHLEGVLWPEGPVCPHCGTFSLRHYNLAKTRMGLRKCAEKGCRKQFTVKVGTVFESAHIPLHKMLQATFLMCASKKGVSAHQLHRLLGVTYKSAWFLAHRIREAMRSGALAAPFGEGGGAVEVDETYIGTDPAKPYTKGFSRGYQHKMKVLSLVDRDSGMVRSFHVDHVSARDLAPIVRANLAKEAHLMTDEAAFYTKVGREFAAHDVVAHKAGEYGRGIVHTNTIEGFFSVFKRGMKGVYQHCGKQHLHRYLAEFDFRYNNRVRLGVGDSERNLRALAGVVGKRLTYRPVDRA